MRINRKVRSRAGFTLAETLLAVLILLLVSSILVAGLPSARNAYEKVVLGSNAQLLLSTTVSALRDELGTAREIAGDSTDPTAVTYFGADTGAKSKISVSDTDSKIMIQDYASVDLLNVGAGSYGEPRPLISDAAVTSGLSVTYASVNVDTAKGVVTFKNLRVMHGTNVVASLSDSGDSDLVIRSVFVE